ncbi:unnamed protein product, partial [Ectocarpus fasciculatus]
MEEHENAEETDALISVLEIEDGKPEVKKPSEPDGNERLPSLFGIRGFFIIFVFITHCNWKIVRNSWMIIGAFFSFSGILVTSMTLKTYEKYGSISILGFYQRRIARLIPTVFLVVTAICMYIGCMRFFYPGYITPVELYWHRRDMLAATYYLSNWHLIVKGEDYFSSYAPLSLLRHFWSLAIEEQYYIVWPLLVSMWTSLFP